jgi:hypothetical protein
MKDHMKLFTHEAGSTPEQAVLHVVRKSLNKLTGLPEFVCGQDLKPVSSASTSHNSFP